MSNNTLAESDGGGGGGCNGGGRSVAAANGGHDRTNEAGGGGGGGVVSGYGNGGYAGELDEILRCAVCLDRMTDPRILPCQHTFCASPCLEGLIDASRVLRCPECRERYLAPAGGVRQLPSNRLIINLLELAASSATAGEGRQTTEVDGNSPRDATASRRCRMCRRDDVPTLAVCLHCKKQICSECRAAHTRQLHHDCSLLIGRVRRQLPGITDRLAELNAAASTVRANADALRTEVGSLFERLVARFRAREATLLDELRVREEDQLRKLRVLRTEHESAIERATEFCDTLERRMRASTGEGQSNGGGLGGGGGFGGDEPGEADIVACHRQCIDHLEDLERLDGRDRGELRPRILRFYRSRCLDLVEACDVGAFAAVDSFPENSAPDSSSAALNSSESLVREFLQPSPPSHLIGFSSNAVQEHSLAAQEAATAAVATAAREHIGSNGLVDELSLLLQSVRPNDGAGTTSSDRLLDGVALLQRLSQPQLPMPLLPLPLPPPPDHSLPDLAALGSPLAAVHNALLDYMRATRPFVSPPLLADAQSVDVHGLHFERPDVGGDGGGDDNHHHDDAVHTDALPRHLGRVAEASGSAVGGDLLSYQDVTFPSVSVGESVLNESSAALSRPPGFLSVPLRGGVGPASSSSSAIDYQRKVLPSFKIGISRGTEVGSLTWPRGVAASPVNDTIVVADSGNQRVQVFDRQGRFVHAFGAYGQGDGQFDTPTGVAVTGGGHIVVSDRYNGRLLVFDAYGDFVRRIGGGSGSAPGQMSQPWGVACDRSDGGNEGRVYVCDKGNHRVQVFGLASGELLGAFGRLGDRDGELNGPSYVCVSTNGERVAVSDSGNNRVQLFTTDGEFVAVVGSGEGSSAGQLRRPRGVAIDERGFVVVADSGNNRVQVFRPDGSLHWVFGTWGHGDGSMKGAEGVALNSCGQIVVVDRDNHRVQVF